jgi:hypothetical protein
MRGKKKTPLQEVLAKASQVIPANPHDVIETPLTEAQEMGSVGTAMIQFDALGEKAMQLMVRGMREEQIALELNVPRTVIGEIITAKLEKTQITANRTREILAELSLDDLKRRVYDALDQKAYKVTRDGSLVMEKVFDNDGNPVIDLDTGEQRLRPVVDHQHQLEVLTLLKDVNQMYGTRYGLDAPKKISQTTPDGKNLAIKNITINTDTLQTMDMQTLEDIANLMKDINVVDEQ